MMLKRIVTTLSCYFLVFLILLLLQACSYPTIPRIEETAKAPKEPSAGPPPEQNIGEIFQKKAPVLASQPERKEKEYEIGPEDTLEVMVWDHDDLKREVYVSREGVFSYPLIGTVQAGGLTVEQLEKEICNRLSGKYIIDPQVTVTVKEFKSKKVLVMGEVGGTEGKGKGPGAYPLTGKTTLMEILTMTGGPTKNAGTEINVMRPRKTGGASGPQEKSANDEVIKVNLRKLLEGDPSQNIYLEPNDTVYVSKAAFFYVYGEVKTPGRYNLERGTTVLKAITTAGGATEKAAVNRTKVVREKGGQKSEMRVNLTDPVEAEDIVMVPESFF
jgi:polysaccharide export outer membrane protein